MIDTEKMPLTEADTASYDSTAQIMKAAMAYVNPSLGRMLAVMAKSIELQHMMQYLNQGGVSACGVQNRGVPPEEVLRDLRKYCGAREKEQLDRCLNLMNMAKMYEMYRNFSGSGDLSAMASMMSSAAGTSPTGTSFAGFAAGSASAGASEMGTETSDCQKNSNYNESDYLRKMQSMLTPEQMELIRNISNQQNT